MIFATIGTQAPFDRFVRIIDEVAANIEEEVIVQALSPNYQPKHVRVVNFLPPNEFNEVFTKARLIVAHAGMGTIISALRQGKPIIIFPRIAALGEHRNEHQMDTAEKMKQLNYVYVAFDESQLKQLMFTQNLQPLYKLGELASQNLIDSLIENIG